MTCRHAEPLLNALADHELSRWQAARVRRHLAACPACAAEYAAIQRLDASVQARRDVPAPSAHGPRIAAALPPSAAFQTCRRTFPLRPAAVGLAGVAAAVAAAFWFLPGQPGQPTIAFADVQKAMQQVQTVSWKTHYIVTDANWQPLAQKQASGNEFITWVRRNPPAVATLGLPPGYLALKNTQGNFDRTAQGNYLVRPASAMDRKHFAADVEGQIESLTRQPWGQSSKLVFIPSHAVYDVVTNRQQQLVILNRQKQILFSYDDEIVVRPTSHIPEMHYFHHVSTWVNSITHLVSRSESRNWGDKMSGQFNQRQIIILDDFHYNQNPPPGVFDWSPPPGANVINPRDLRTDKRLRLYLPKKGKAGTGK